MALRSPSWRAYELAPAYQVLYNIAGTCYQLKDYACALRAFEKYLASTVASRSRAARRARWSGTSAVLREPRSDGRDLDIGAGRRDLRGRRAGGRDAAP